MPGTVHTPFSLANTHKPMLRLFSYPYSRGGGERLNSLVRISRVRYGRVHSGLSPRLTDFNLASLMPRSQRTVIRKVI